MEHQEIEAPGELRGIIKCFWYFKRDFGSIESNFEIMPDGYAEISFCFGQPCSLVSGGKLIPLPSPFIMGMLNQPVVLHTKDVFEVIGIRCYPWTVFDLLGLPPGKEEVHFFHHPISQLQSTLAQLLQDGNPLAALTTVKDYCLQATPHVAIDDTIFKAGIAMRESNGAIPVSQVAAAAHASIRTLERKFKQSAGFTVKDVTGLIRFEQVRNHLWKHPDANLAGLAEEMGYTDQAHLSREFKRYSGTTPAAFARHAKKML
ncbi:helix-turn-helix protein [Chitinophaga skermanii]|uniref:Helix-turn-helix protein n=1 Tax=Chitinophaga skermanii TaxID=331697 RepID=A0A327QY10_9BACT|nr:helix-turn-helix domain-containing protein [Chitinophaga skermanii]RAJ08638.1 helix-turn-helix protein [Chitinophaga skermanii]